MRVRNGIQCVVDGLNGVADRRLGNQIGDFHQLGLAVLEVLDGKLHDLLRGFGSRGVLELDEVGVGHAGNIAGGDELGVEALGQRP